MLRREGKNLKWMGGGALKEGEEGTEEGGRWGR